MSARYVVVQNPADARLAFLCRQNPGDPHYKVVSAGAKEQIKDVWSDLPPESRGEPAPGPRVICGAYWEGPADLPATGPCEITAGVDHTVHEDKGGARWRERTQER